MEKVGKGKAELASAYAERSMIEMKGIQESIKAKTEKGTKEYINLVKNRR